MKKARGEGKGRKEALGPGLSPEQRQPCPHSRAPSRLIPSLSPLHPGPVPSHRALPSDLAPSPALSSRRTGPASSMAAPERERAAARRRGDGRGERTDPAGR